MPYYDLFCANCNKEFEIKATMEEKTGLRIPCPECGSTDLKTVYNSAPAYLKNVKEPAQACPHSRTCGSSGCRWAG